MSRVLVVTNDFPPRKGGIETFVKGLVDRLPAADVVVYTSAEPGADRHDAALPYPVVRDRARLLLPTPRVGRTAERLLVDHACDRVVFGAAMPLGLLARRLRSAGAHRVVALTHGHEVWWARLPLSRGLLRRVGETTDVLTYVSRWCAERIAAALGEAASARMAPLPPGADTARFHPGVGGAEVRRRLGLDPDAYVVVCVSRLVRRKGQDVLVRSWPRVLARHPGAVLLLVGDGPQRRRLARLVRRAGLEESVRLLGPVPWEEVPAYLGAGDLFALPCRTRRLGLEAEAFGIVYHEAAACGLPLVAGRSGGVPEAVAGLEVPVRLVDGRSVAQVAAALAARDWSAAGQPGRLRPSVAGGPMAERGLDASAAALRALLG